MKTEQDGIYDRGIPYTSDVRSPMVNTRGHTPITGTMAPKEEVSQETADGLRDILLRNGFVRCDLPACNCGSWHHRYGLPERWEEIKEELAAANHPLCNENGWLVLRALHALVEERDRWRAQALQPRRRTDEEIRARIARHQAAVDEEEENGGQGNEDWLLVLTAKCELQWVLGERECGVEQGALEI